MCDTELQHFSHEHPLILCEQKTTDDGGDEKTTDDDAGKTIDDDKKKTTDEVCNGCVKKISGSAYRCGECSFSLHVICATLLPPEIEHPMHHHPLRLLPKAPYSSFDFGCDACRILSGGFTYHCSLCQFDLDIECALTVAILKHEGHKHPLSLVSNPASFECHACGTINKELERSCKCHTCLFWIHESCASVPATIEYGGHHHPLTLAYSAEDISFSIIHCCACREKLKRNCWNYRCKKCCYNVHLQCSKWVSEIAMEETKFDDPNLLRLPLPNEPTNLIERLMKRISQENTKEEIRLSLQMIHEHTLTLFDGQSDYESYHSAAGSEESSYIIENNNQKKNEIKVCDACAQPIMDPPFYSCLVCNFSLHKWCSELPSKVQVQYHPHLLNLQVKNYPSCHGFFKCSNCKRMSNGFRFQCYEYECYDFCVDMVCASLPNSILHDAHDHRLVQKRDCRGQHCNSCKGGVVGPVFGCPTCNFNLHLACALLPRSITHRFEKHPFSLTYAPVENGPDEYYCEFCEGKINPTRWFYHCDKCDQSVLR